MLVKEIVLYFWQKEPIERIWRRLCPVVCAQEPTHGILIAMKTDQLQVDNYFMGKALEKATEAFEKGEVPIGAVIVRDQKILGMGRNRVEECCDVTAHAEMEAIRNAQLLLGDWRLTATTIYVTKEPCLMCYGAILLSRIARVVFGIEDPKKGIFRPPTFFFNGGKKLEITSGIRSEESLELMKRFFFVLRNKKRELPLCDIEIS